MQHLRDSDIEQLLTPELAIEALDTAYRSFSAGNAAMQPRVRTDAGAIKLSTLGAVLPAEGFAGAKIYTTLAGRFSFVLVLFSTEDGRLLATLDGGALTRLRTAATTALAARALARSDSRVLAVFGTGAQAGAHIRALAKVFALSEVRVVSRGATADFVATIARETGLPAQGVLAPAALDAADVVVTATRATSPLFSGRLIPSGAFIAAVGSSRPDTRELDDEAIARCTAIVVEWKEQARREAGDLIQAGDEVDWESVKDLGDVLTGRVPGRQAPSDIVLFKSVGVGLADVALAGLAYRRALESGTRDIALR